VRIERRLLQPRWLVLAVPIGSLACAFAVMAVVLAATGHDPGETYRKLFDSAFLSSGGLSSTFVFATPIVFTGLAAAAAFRMQLFNIGGEGQFFIGAITSTAVALKLGDHHVGSTAVMVLAMCAAGAAGGAVWAAIPGVLRAFLRTSEIITSLMLNYVAGLILNYVIIDSLSYWRDTETFEGKSFPLAKTLPDAANWPSATLGSGSGAVVLPLGFGIAVILAALLWLLYTRTRFGFEVQVIGDSPRAARYAGMRMRRKIVAVMLLSGAIAGVGGASQEGDFAHQLDPTGLQSSFYGYTGIVVAALARYNFFAVCLVGFLLGGLLNAGFTLQGADFPSGLVGVMQGIILVCALGGELLVRYRVRLGRVSGETAPTQAAEAGP
jgi:general nucleoside transport system permease protein